MRVVRKSGSRRGIAVLISACYMLSIGPLWTLAVLLWAGFHGDHVVQYRASAFGMELLLGHGGENASSTSDTEAGLTDHHDAHTDHVVHLAACDERSARQFSRVLPSSGSSLLATMTLPDAWRADLHAAPGPAFPPGARDSRSSVLHCLKSVVLTV